MSQARGPRYNQVTVVGVGLIGGSIGKALLSRELTKKVVGVGRSRNRLQSAIDLNAITEFSTDLRSAVDGADVVVVCTPVDTIAQFVSEIVPLVGENVLVTDGGSTKRQIVEEVSRRFPGECRFIGSHPLAGGEQTGVEHAEADLFDERTTIITPTETTTPELIECCRRFWESLGSSVAVMSADEHDAVVATISHVPHVMASLLAAATPERHLPYASTGFRDTTRVASGDVDMWLQIIEQNRMQIQRSLLEVETRLIEFRRALEDGDFSTIRKILELGKKKRDAVAS